MTQIVESGNQYCLGLKANQKTLLQQAQHLSQTQVPLSVWHELDLTHGRSVERTVRVFAAPPAMQQQWCGLAAVVAIDRRGVRDGKPFQRCAWCILSQIIPAAQAARMIRDHRGSIENKLHWVKDVIQAEDASLIRATNPAKVMALLRSWAITSFRLAGYASLSKAARLFKHDLPKLLSFL